MTFDFYQKESVKTATFPDIGGVKYLYPVLGLAGETGELVDKVKKLHRDNNGIITEEWKTSILFEMSDVLWYLSNLCTVLEVPFEQVARMNLEKLADRKKRNVIHGSGDNR